MILLCSWFKRAGRNGSKVTWRSWRYWLRFYRHRVVRLWPVYAYAVFSYAFFYYKVWPHPSSEFPPSQGRGLLQLTTRPMFQLIDDIGRCQATGWRNLLFLNSFLMDHDQCMIWSW